MTTKLKDKNLTSWDDHLDKKYGKKGSMTREKYEEDFETFKIGVLIQEARKRQHLTQEELAIKVGTTKNYISRIENNASDIRLTTLMRIIREGLGGRLKFSIDI
jgi:DNA-binding XRE family transcriptional regulator